MKVGAPRISVLAVDSYVSTPECKKALEKEDVFILIGSLGRINELFEARIISLFFYSVYYICHRR
ncbi:unnamed protein product [Gongylonema pulchrum]|uniref:Mur_ligase domain-containing protein n=1 Tax=Gongylonema pulchrum TaxID=637853 RepID=A0A183DE02_9BILA|nr:unnamed protein product [Gongylonema pulchrum]